MDIVACCRAQKSCWLRLQDESYSSGSENRTCQLGKSAQARAKVANPKEVRPKITQLGALELRQLACTALSFQHVIPLRPSNYLIRLQGYNTKESFHVSIVTLCAESSNISLS